MKYYLLSFIITVFIFTIIQYLDYSKKNKDTENDNYQEPYDLFSTNNFLLFGIIYVVMTIGAYYLDASNFNFSLPSFLTSINSSSNTIINTTTEPNIKEVINPQILSKINDNFDIGLDPFNSDDTSSISSLSSSN